MITIETTMFPEGPRRFSIAAGKTVHGYSPASSTPVKTQTFVSGSSASAKAIAVITQVPNRVPYGTFYLGADGVFTNLYIPISEVTLAPAPVSPAPVDLTPFSQEDIDAAVVAAVTPLNARIAGIKKKVAVAAQDIADD